MVDEQVVIRRAQRSDAAVLARFNQAMAKETEGLTLVPATVTAGVMAVFEEAGRGFYVVAEAEGEVVAGLMVTREWSDWRCGEWWWIQSVYVVQEWRRQGLYGRLYAEVRAMAEEAGGVCGFRLYVERDNQVAQHSYTALGMQETRYRVYEEEVGVGVRDG